MKPLLARLGAIVLVGFVLVNLLACGNVQQAAQKAQRRNPVQELGLAYLNYESTNAKGPSGPQDLQQFGVSSQAMAALQSGQIVLIWGIKMTDMIEVGTYNTVLGYEAVVPQTGGWVLMGDGTVVEMTPAEFANAKMAKPKDQKKQP